MNVDNFKDNLKVMNSDGEFDRLEKSEEIREEMDEQTDSINERDKRWLSQFLEEQISLAKSVGRKEAEMRGNSQMKQMMIMVAAALLFSVVSAGVSALSAYGMIG